MLYLSLNPVPVDHRQCIRGVSNWKTELPLGNFPRRNQPALNELALSVFSMHGCKLPLQRQQVKIDFSWLTWLIKKPNKV